MRIGMCIELIFQTRRLPIYLGLSRFVIIPSPAPDLSPCCKTPPVTSLKVICYQHVTSHKLSMIVLPVNDDLPTQGTL